MRKLTYSLIAGLALFAGAILLITNSQSQYKATPPVSTPPRIGTNASFVASSSSVDVPVVAVSPEIPVSIMAILPGLSSSVADWRSFRPDTLTISPDAKLAIPFRVGEVTNVAGRTVWKGRNASLPGAFLVTTATKNEWTAVMSVPGMNTFEYVIRNGVASVKEIPVTGETCGISLDAESLNHPLAGAPLGAEVAAEKAQYLVDVAFFYDANALLEAGAPETIENRMIARIEASNQVLVNSQVTNFAWRYVGSFKTPTFQRDGTMETDLSRMVYELQAGGGANPLAPFVKEKGAAVGADQMVLIVGEPYNWAGMAYMPGNYAVVGWASTSYFTLTHELGHNFGCNHNRKQVNPTTENAGDGKYNYGYVFEKYDPVFKMNLTYGTIMSYSNATPYFSNPDVLFEGQPMGIPVGQPKASHNAKILIDNASSVAAYRTAIGAPVITVQPASKTVVLGSALSLNVSAAGENLTYQWYKDGVAINDATASTYSKADASTSDQGSFGVTVSNAVASTASSLATITVSDKPAVTPPASTPPSGGGGGGGGGSPSLWFLGAISGLAALRHFSKSKVR